MEPNVEVIVTHGDAMVILHVKDYADLTVQAARTLSSLPPVFSFTHKHPLGETVIDSQPKFETVPRSQVAILAVTETAPSRLQHTPARCAPRVRLANLAYLKREKAKANAELIPDSTEAVPDEDRCPICMDRLRRPMKAKCGHICCLHCWERALERFLECPLCRGRVRLKTLRPV